MWDSGSKKIKRLFGGTNRVIGIPTAAGTCPIIWERFPGPEDPVTWSKDKRLRLYQLGTKRYLKVCGSQFLPTNVVIKKGDIIGDHPVGETWRYFMGFVLMANHAIMLEPVGKALWVPDRHFRALSDRLDAYIKETSYVLFPRLDD